MENFFSKWTIPLILLLCIWTASNVNWGKERWKFIITSDGKGYYAYLPATIIYHDYNFGFFDTIEKKYYDQDTKYDYRTGADGKVIDKYFCGVSVLQLPFFLVAHSITKISGGTADGYSKWYAIFMNLAAIFYLGIGLIYLRKLLKMFGAENGISSFVLAVIVFATNLFYYTVFEPCMSHVYSFAMISIFLVYAKKWMDAGRKKYILYIAFLLGAIIIIRPVNGMIILALPFLAGNFNLFFTRLKELFRLPYILTASFIVFAYMLSIQSMVYHFETGHFYVNAYGDEKFNFLHPEIFNFLFSYKKGLFVYLPITFISLFGFIPMWKADRFRAVYLFFLLFLFIYILSCWWMWYYGGSFGTRVIVEFLPLFAILLFYLIRSVKIKIAGTSLITLIVLVALFCQFQTLQYRYLVIHWSDMNKEKYWDVFLNTDFLKKK